MYGSSIVQQPATFISNNDLIRIVTQSLRSPYMSVDRHHIIPLAILLKVTSTAPRLQVLSLVNLGSRFTCFTADVPTTVLLPINDHHTTTTTYGGLELAEGIDLREGVLPQLALIIPLFATPTTIPMTPTLFKWTICQRTPRSELWWGRPRYSIPKNPNTSPPFFARPPRWRRSIRAIKDSGDDVLTSERISCFCAHGVIVLRFSDFFRRWALGRDGTDLSPR
ncbi:hypothetical protein F4805DRAFT_331922 [Annulohypoxylon moriforme]|nr:hypothetical protein F4805DRAFT_331922 [Annulohypoxylon moriforme]